MINLIKTTIPHIGRNYYGVTNPVTRNGHITGYTLAETHPEQNFVTELFSQLRQRYHTHGITIKL